MFNFREHEKKSIHRDTDCVNSQQYDGGTSAADLCREHGISTATLYNWKAKYGGLEASQLKRI
ncbi:transposase, partial [Chryseolinea sp. Jin1]|nr:transposase [Chryseolinea lacunae]